MNKLKLVVALTIAVSGFANAALIDVSNNRWTPGQIIPAPLQVTDVNIGSDNRQFGFDERQGVYLENDLLTSTAIIQAGTRVNSHLIFLNHEQQQDYSRIRADNTWTFDGKILGIMTDFMGVFEVASSALLGAPGTVYPTDPFRARGLERNDRTWLLGSNSLRVLMRVSQPGDWIRVITAVPEPGTIGLIALGGIALLFARRRTLAPTS